MPDENDDQQPQGPAELREAYKRASARAAELETQVGQAELIKRENAMLRAGIDLDSPVGKLFSKAYDGELDPEAVKSAYAEVSGPSRAVTEGEQTETVVDDGPTEAEREQQRLRGVLATDATPPGSEPAPDPWDQAYGEFNSTERRTQPTERRAAAAIQHVINAANNGDERVVFQKPGEDLATATERWRRDQM